MTHTHDLFQVKQNVVINYPVEAVFSYVSNFENAKEWIVGIEEMQQISKGELKVGTKGLQVRPWLGRRDAVEFEIMEYEPNQKITYRVDSGFIAPFEIVELFEPIDQGTLVTFIAQGKPKGIAKLSWPIASRLYARQIEADLSNLKMLLETEKTRKVFIENYEDHVK